jgi:predicted metal-binding protein
MTYLGKRPAEVRQIPAAVDTARLPADIEKLKNQALSDGASDSAIVNHTEIIFNPDLLKKVASDNNFPSVHWPLVYPKDEIREAIDAFEWAVFFRMPVDNAMPDYGGGPVSDEAHRRIFSKTYQIVTDLESTAFYMGYHLAIGLAAGNCRAVFCGDEKRCPPMYKGQACVRPNAGRPSMESAGIDAVAIAKHLNWKMPKDASYPVLAGLVLIV